MSCNFDSGFSLQEDSRHRNPTSSSTGILQGSINEGQSSSLHMTSLPSISPIRRIPDIEVLRSLDHQPQNGARKPGAGWPFHKTTDSRIDKLYSKKKKSSDSLGAPKYRVVGRGGSGSRIRSDPPVFEPQPNVPHPHPVHMEPTVPRPPSNLEVSQSSDLPPSSFRRPTGRGGAGSSTKLIAPIKPPSAILNLLHGRKPSEAEPNEQGKLLQGPIFVIRTQSSYPNLNPTRNRSFTRSSSSRSMSDDMSISLSSIIEEPIIPPRNSDPSSSNPVVSKPNNSPPPPRQPSEPSFRRPTGRGGAGSSTKPLAPLKPPTVILGLLPGRKKSEAQLNEQGHVPAKLHLGYPIPFTISSYSDGSRSPPFSPTSSTLEKLEGSVSRNSESDDEDDIDSYFEREIYYERRQRSINKLAKTLGSVPPPLWGDYPSGSVSKDPVVFNQSRRNGSQGLRRRASMLSSLSDKVMVIGPRSSHHSLTRSMNMDDLHQLGLLDDSDNISYAESEFSHSPITFSPPSPVNSRPRPKLNLDNSQPTEPSIPSSSAPHFYVSDHSTSHSMPLQKDLPPDPDRDVVPAKSNWLVPLATYNDEVVISFRSSPSKPQSWTGEWNCEMHDVIQNLRRL